MINTYTSSHQVFLFRKVGYLWHLNESFKFLGLWGKSFCLVVEVLVLEWFTLRNGYYRIKIVFAWRPVLTIHFAAIPFWWLLLYLIFETLNFLLSIQFVFHVCIFIHNICFLLFMKDGQNFLSIVVQSESTWLYLIFISCTCNMLLFVNSCNVAYNNAVIKKKLWFSLGFSKTYAINIKLLF